VSLAQPRIVVNGLPTAAVAYGDLDLSRAAGQAVLRGRVHRAATSVCVDPGSRGVGESRLQQQCLDFALARAQVQIEQAIASYENRQLAERASLMIAVR
jgi:UrcA family protein